MSKRVDWLLLQRKCNPSKTKSSLYIPNGQPKVHFCNPPIFVNFYIIIACCWPHHIYHQEWRNSSPTSSPRWWRRRKDMFRTIITISWACSTTPTCRTVATIYRPFRSHRITATAPNTSIITGEHENLLLNVRSTAINRSIIRWVCVCVRLLFRGADICHRMQPSWSWTIPKRNLGQLYKRPESERGTRWVVFASVSAFVLLRYFHLSRLVGFPFLFIFYVFCLFLHTPNCLIVINQFKTFNILRLIKRENRPAVTGAVIGLLFKF